MFVAFESPACDGHSFLVSAKEQGASSALVRREQAEVDLPQLVVDDTQAALASMARSFRASWDFPVVGITGSCGKTTFKDLLVRILGNERVLGTRENFNNLIGVPLSILRAEALTADAAVLEAGISEVGEMRQLASIIDPDIVVVTAIGPAHLEDLETEETIAIEKGRLAQGDRVKTVFAGETCEPFAGYLGGLKVNIVKPCPRLSETWGYRFVSENGQTRIEQEIRGGVECYSYRGIGNGLASNVALAVATARSLGLSPKEIQRGLDAWKPSKLRGEWRDFGDSKAYVDCYNANPLSMRDSLETFVYLSNAEKPRLYIIGCMEELGADSPKYHEALGRRFPYRPQDLILVIGDDAESVVEGMSNAGFDTSNCEIIKSLDEARERVDSFDGDIFLKGSRRYRLEEALKGGARC